MSAHDSLIPGEEKARHFRFDRTGGSLSWKGWKLLLGTVLTVLLGSGGFVGLQLVTTTQLDAAIQLSKIQQASEYEEEFQQVRTNTKEIKLIKTRMGDIERKLDDVQSFQYKQDSRQEARRITDKITNRELREQEYDRIRDLNEKRAKQGKDPCTTLECLN